MAKTEVKRFRLNVPINDGVVLAWLDAQANMSASMRELIRRQVNEDGICDIYSSDAANMEYTPVKRRKSTIKRTRKNVVTTQVQVEQPSIEASEQATNSVTPTKVENKTIAKAPRSQRKVSSQSNGANAGIRLASDSLSEFGVDLAIDDANEEASADNGVDALDEISRMMGES